MTIKTKEGIIHDTDQYGHDIPLPLVKVDAIEFELDDSDDSIPFITALNKARWYEYTSENPLGRIAQIWITEEDMGELIKELDIYELDKITREEQLLDFKLLKIANEDKRFNHMDGFYKEGWV